MIFSIAMGAKYLSYVKSIATFAPTFYGYIISVLASVQYVSCYPLIFLEKVICQIRSVVILIEDIFLKLKRVTLSNTFVTG